MKLTIIIGLFILLVISLGFNFYPKQIEIIEEKALLDVGLYDWAINVDNVDEIFFEYFIYNYGKVEAKNVKVRCTLWDESGEIKTTVIQNVGNVASFSSPFQSVITDYTISEDELFVSDCFVESCDDCDILWKKIPRLVDWYS